MEKSLWTQTIAATLPAIRILALAALLGAPGCGEEAAEAPPPPAGPLAPEVFLLIEEVKEIKPPGPHLGGQPIYEYKEKEKNFIGQVPDLAPGDLGFLGVNTIWTAPGVGGENSLQPIRALPLALPSGLKVTAVKADGTVVLDQQGKSVVLGPGGRLALPKERTPDGPATTVLKNQGLLPRSLLKPPDDTGS